MEECAATPDEVISHLERRLDLRARLPGLLQVLEGANTKVNECVADIIEENDWLEKNRLNTSELIAAPDLDAKISS